LIRYEQRLPAYGAARLRWRRVRWLHKDCEPPSARPLGLPSMQTASSMKMLDFRMAFASAVWAASRGAGASCGVRLVRNDLAVPEKGVEGLDCARRRRFEQRTGIAVSRLVQAEVNPGAVSTSPVLAHLPVGKWLKTASPSTHLCRMSFLGGSRRSYFQRRQRTIKGARQPSMTCWTAFGRWTSATKRGRSRRRFELTLSAISSLPQRCCERQVQTDCGQPTTTVKGWSCRKLATRRAREQATPGPS
jgi:hypothetical protein